jgi:hypothetical protein
VLAGAVIVPALMVVLPVFIADSWKPNFDNTTVEAVDMLFPITRIV